MIDTDVYTIKDDKPHELYGHYVNFVFTKIPQIAKIIVKGRTKTNGLDDLEAKLNGQS